MSLALTYKNLKMQGQKLTKAIEESNLTRQQLADKVGVSVSIISKYCTGKARIPEKRINQINDALGFCISKQRLTEESKNKKTKIKETALKQIEGVKKYKPAMKKSLISGVPCLIDSSLHYDGMGKDFKQLRNSQGLTQYDIPKMDKIQTYIGANTRDNWKVIEATDTASVALQIAWQAQFGKSLQEMLQPFRDARLQKSNAQLKVTKNSKKEQIISNINRINDLLQEIADLL